jgi:hypothetical protein
MSWKNPSSYFHFGFVLHGHCDKVMKNVESDEIFFCKYGEFFVTSPTKTMTTKIIKRRQDNTKQLKERKVSL